MLYIFLIIIAIAIFGIANLVYKKQFDVFLHIVIFKKLRSIIFSKERRFKKFKFRKVKNEDFWLKKIEKHPKDAKNYKGLGGWYVENNNKYYAIQTLEYAVKLNPSDKKLVSTVKKLRSEA